MCMHGIPILSSGCHHSYRRFLLMARDAGPQTTLVPMYHIDLIWHAHMACSREYVQVGRG